MAIPSINFLVGITDNINFQENQDLTYYHSFSCTHFYPIMPALDQISLVSWTTNMFEIGVKKTFDNGNVFYIIQ